MAKKIVGIVIVILIVCILVGVVVILKQDKELTQEEIQMIIQDSYLDILVDIDEYSKENIDNEIILETSMRIARELDLPTFDENISSYEYVKSSYIEKIAFELTGKKLTEPIIVDYHKYYYPYNAEHNIYEIIPMGTNWVHLDSIRTIEKEGDIYYIDCSAKVQDGEYYIYADSVKIQLQYMPKNEYVKYMINSITSTNRYYLPKKAQNVIYDKLIDIEKANDIAKQYILDLQSQDMLSSINVDNYYGQYVYNDTKKEVNNNGSGFNVQDKLCIAVKFYANVEPYVNISVYIDAYTGEVYGVDTAQ